MSVPPDPNDVESANAPDPFDPASLRIEPDGEPGSGVKRLLTQVPVRRPHNHEFFRCHSDPAYRLRMAVLVHGMERDVYAVMPAVAALVAGELKPVEMRLCVSRAGAVFLWDVPLPTEDGRRNAWDETKRDVAEQAETRWTRMRSNRSVGHYEILVAEVEGPDPKWPELSFRDLLSLAFGKGRLIDSVDHPVLKQLRGE
jgi:hypothetical protein